MSDLIKETINKLRTIILDRVKDTCGFSSKEVTEHNFARHRGSEKKDRNAWESVLLRKGKIEVFLTFVSPSQLSQTINLHGNTFSVCLFVYDSSIIDVHTSKKNACDRLLELISENDIYGIAEVQERRRINARKSKTKSVGHVLNLYIKNTGKDWSILRPDQLEEASADLIAKVVATLKDLLPVAEYYFNNREALLRGNQ